MRSGYSHVVRGRPPRSELAVLALIAETESWEMSTVGSRVPAFES